MLKIGNLHLKPSMVNLMVAVFCILASSGCQEHKRLDAVIRNTKQEADALRIQLNTANEEYELCVKSLNILKSQQAKLSAPSSFDEKARKLEAEVNALNDHKSLLEQTVLRLEQDVEEYRKSSV